MYWRTQDAKVRKLVFDHYGRICQCCGTTEALSIDHINGGGQKEKRERKTPLYKWLVKMRFPEGFQTLCHNCNVAKGVYGICPHKRTPRIVKFQSRTYTRRSVAPDCKACGGERWKSGGVLFAYCHECQLLYQKSRKFGLRMQVMRHYGFQCAWCDEKNIFFLTIDHVEGGGRKHKRSDLARYVIKNNFPPQFQILCYNCNYLKFFGRPGLPSGMPIRGCRPEA